MPVLSKLTCGIIYTDTFERYLQQIHADQAEDNPNQILTFEYVRCASGTLKGKSWWQLIWTPIEAAPDFRRHKIGHVWVYITKQVQHGLRERCLDCQNGMVVVLPP